MNKTFNILTAIIGICMLFCGIAKLLGHMDPLTINWNRSYINLDTRSNIFYVVMVNFLGGMSMIIHAIRTLNFKDFNYLDEGLVDNRDKLETRQLNRLEMISGSYVIILSLWFILYLLGMLSAFLGGAPGYLFLLVIVTLGMAATAIIPLILVAKNYSLNRKISKRLNSAKLAEFHAKKKEAGITSRR